MQRNNKQTCNALPSGCVHQCAGCDLAHPHCPDAVKETCPFYHMENGRNSANGAYNDC